MSGRFVIVAGGTGGHMYPGIALARALRARQPAWDVVFIVRTGDLGQAVLEREGFAVQPIAGQGLPRSLNLKALAFPFRFIKSGWEAAQALKRLRPQAVVGMGGYLSFPVLLLARILGIPTFIHEQNSIPGLTNRFLARWVTEVAVSFPDSAGCFSGSRVWVSGLPVRSEIGRVGSDEGRRRFGLDQRRLTLLVFGGSQGARSLNEALVKVWRSLTGLAPRFQVLHIAGPQNEAAMAAAYRGLPIRSTVLGYCHDMPSAYAAADLVICRAGASTIAELLAAARPAVLIPFPFASDNHQFFNAQVLARRGLAEVVLERDLGNEAFRKRLEDRIEHPDVLRAQQAQMQASELRALIGADAAKMAERFAGQVTGAQN